MSVARQLPVVLLLVLVTVLLLMVPEFVSLAGDSPAMDGSMRTTGAPGGFSYPEKSQLFSSDGAPNDRFGIRLAVAGDVVVVGAAQHDTAGNANQGAAYVFVKPAEGWDGDLVESARLVASDGQNSANFGRAVAIEGDIIVVGAFKHDFGGTWDQGEAYVFVKPPGGWKGTLTETARLVASDGAPSDEFGNSVAISGDTIVVGAWMDDVGTNTNQGSAYLFTKPPAGWSGVLTETAHLKASDGAIDDYLGTSVTTHNETVVVGAYGDDVNGVRNQGSAYSFVEPPGGWSGTLTEQGHLTNSDGGVGNFFGSYMAQTEENMVIGAGGFPYVFVKPPGGWNGNLTESARLHATDNGDGFGLFVSMSGDTIVAGAPFADINGRESQGAAYVFKEPLNGWEGDLFEQAKITASNGVAFDLFGYNVAISGDTIVANATNHDANGNDDQGTAYIFVETVFTPTPTPAPSNTPTPIIPNTPSATPISSTPTPTVVVTATVTPLATSTSTATPAASTHTPTVTTTRNPPSTTPTATATTVPSVSPTPSPASTVEPSETPTKIPATVSPLPTATGVLPTVTPTVTIPVLTPTPTVTGTAAAEQKTLYLPLIRH